jgi:D-glycero-alpha-D-manno-heptose-7-phosphate kinase
MASKIKVSAPCRIDIGGTWDMDMFIIPYQDIRPSTITMALDYRTYVEIEDYKDGYIFVSEGDEEEIIKYNLLPFTGKFGLIYSIVTYFGIQNLSIKIHKVYPYKSGLGGSGSLASCLIFAINKYLNLCMSRKKIIKLAHDIENSLCISHCGYQDQCAAIYGGIKQWTWGIDGKFQYEDLIDSRDGIQKRLVIAYTGMSHPCNINDLQINSYLSSNNRQDWLDINQNTIVCAKAIKEKAWADVSECVSKEHKIRINIVPERLSENAAIFQQECDSIGHGFGIAGSGGCVFYLADKPEKAKIVENKWVRLCSEIYGAKMIEPKIVIRGVLSE